MLSFGSESGRGFGSVFHHHNLKSQLLSVGVFLRPLAGVASGCCGFVSILADFASGLLWTTRRPISSALAPILGAP